jgi:chromosomal replication initiator protein
MNDTSPPTPGSLASIWQACLAQVSARIAHPVWESCQHDLQPLWLQGDTLFVNTGAFSKSMLLGDAQLRNVLYDELSRALQAVTGQTYGLELVSMDSIASQPPSESATPLPPKASSPNAGDLAPSTTPAPSHPSVELSSEHENPYVVGLNPKYTFATFVEGSSNQLAYAAARSVARNPARSYNPLFLYGGVGLGKTHLMQAVGHAMLASNAKARITYVSTETFMNEMIEAISNKSTASFREKYRHVDCLLVDDIQFIINRERTQEEFFHTFNYLHGNDRQIIITSDRPPHELHPLEDRLRSRFTQGLIADIQSPDVETREAILRKKVSEQYQVHVPLDVIGFLAENFPTSVRDLEGSLVRVIAYASTHQRPIDIGLASQAIEQIVPVENRRIISIRAIQEKVCEHFRIKLDDLLGTRRDARFALPRQIAMFLARDLTLHSLKQIADDFNKKDHTTVIHAIRKIEESLSDATIRDNIETIRQRLDQAGA